MVEKRYSCFDGNHIEIKGQELANLLQKEIEGAAEVAKADIKNQIIELEAQVTPRRIREYIITGDKAFIQDIEDQIINLRTEL